MKKVSRNLILVAEIIVVLIAVTLVFYPLNGSSFLCGYLGTQLGNEYNKIDFNCNVDSDCVHTDIFTCGGGCVNKNANLNGYLSVYNVFTNVCPQIAPLCPLFMGGSSGCRCVKNTCDFIRDLDIFNKT